MSNDSIKLIQYNRSGLIEQEHYGYIVGLEYEIGKSGDYPYYLRSCAKPLQASLIVDYELNFTPQEIAICTASHAGEKCHQKIAKKLLKKVGFQESDLKCGLHKPISQTEKIRLLKKGLKKNIFHNNCVGKHIMMLALCKLNDWSTTDYDDVSHPLQIKIKQKIYELCKITKEYPITKDGCGVPIHSMPLQNMVKGYINLFCNEKYKKITNAFREYPYIIGGENRLDTKIMQNSDNLIAKVGAGGLCIVVNLEQKDGFVVKISDCDMKAREIVVLTQLKKLNWANIAIDTEIKTLHGEVIGEIECNI